MNCITRKINLRQNNGHTWWSSKVSPLWYSIIDTSHLNIPNLFIKIDALYKYLKKNNQKKQSHSQSKGQWEEKILDLSLGPDPSKFGGNLFGIFCEILLRIQPTNGHGWGGNDHLSSSEIFQSSAKINYRWAEEPVNLRKCCIYYRLETCLVRNWLVIAPLFLGLQLFSHFINRKMLAAFSDCFFCPTNSQKPNGT